MVINDPRIGAQRLKTLVVNAQTLVSTLAVITKAGNYVTLKGLPLDAEVVGFRVHPFDEGRNRHRFELILRSMEFPVVPAGAPIPQLDVTVTHHLNPEMDDSELAGLESRKINLRG